MVYKEYSFATDLAWKNFVSEALMDVDYSDQTDAFATLAAMLEQMQKCTYILRKCEGALGTGLPRLFAQMKIDELVRRSKEILKKLNNFGELPTEMALGFLDVML